MDGEIKVITLCGSAKFEDEFVKVQEELSLLGNLVLMPVFFKGKKNLTEEQIQRLKEIHLKKIAMADAIFVINKGGYIGESTQKEINYAKKLNKEIIYLEK